MTFHLIEGTFHVLGDSPDGDSVVFRAKNKAHWKLLAGEPVKQFGDGRARLRFDAVDALETHYLGQHRQPKALREGAVAHLLAALGIDGVEWNAEGTEVVKAKDGTAGYILSEKTERYRRPLSHVFVGAPPGPDGAAVTLTPALAANSLNAELLRSGFCYPTFYTGMADGLRLAMTELSLAARAERVGVWAEDVTNTGFDVNDMQDLSQRHVILPKLYRRLVTCLSLGQPASNFKAWLQQVGDDPVRVIDKGTMVNLDALIEQAGARIRLTEPPENLSFVP